MFRNIELGDHAWGGFAQNLTWDLSTIDDEVGADLYSVVEHHLEIEIDITTGAGGGVTARELMEWFSVLLQGGPFVGPVVSQVNLWDLCNYLKEMEGVPEWMFAAVAANQTNDIQQALVVIPYASSLLEFPEENWPLAGMCAKQTLRVHTGAAAVNANTTMNACTIALKTRLYKGHSPRLAHPRMIQSVDKELRETFEAGTYHGMLAIAPDGGWAAAANIQNVRLLADGAEIHSSLQPDTVIGAYLATAYYEGVQGIAALGAFSGAGSWTKNYDTIEWFPIIWLSPDFRANRMSQLVGSRNGLLMDSDGTAATLHYVYGMVPLVGSAFAQRALGAIGADPSVVVVSKEVGPEAAVERPSLSAMPFKVDGATNLSRAGRLTVPLQRTKLPQSVKMANPNL